MKLAFVCVFFAVYDMSAARKRIVMEMDIEQEIINLKQSLAQKDADIAALQKRVTDLQQQVGEFFI